MLVASQLTHLKNHHSPNPPFLKRTFPQESELVNSQKKVSLNITLLMCWQSLLCQLDTEVHPQPQRRIIQPRGSWWPVSPGQHILCCLSALGLRTSCLPVCEGSRGARQADACCFMCSSMHMDVQVKPLDKGLRPVKRASLRRDPGKRASLRNSLSCVTFIIVRCNVSVSHHLFTGPLSDRVGGKV